MSNQVSGVPDGFELVAIRQAEDGELFLSPSGTVEEWGGYGSGSVYAILRKIEKPKQYRPFANAAEYMPHWGKPIRQKQDPVGFDSVVSVGDRLCYICISVGITKLFFKDAFNMYEFADGTPFGIEVTP